MAKEMMIILVYDSQMLQKEEDDPASAILYFHPTWVSDQQKTALCGQLMGTVHCVKSIFSAPKIVSLQSGKFFIKEYGRYLMAVGTDRNIADWLLEHRANTMSSLISFFHQDIEIMSKLYDNSAKLSAKLYQLFETYLKYMFLGGNIFSYTPSLKLPKSASNVFLEAIQILQCCQELNYVMGGTLLYHNKVVATQLSSDITKRIVLTDPYRIKCPAETPSVNFELPLGVQLLQVYISCKEYYKLHEEATRSRSIFQYLSSKSIKKGKPVASKEPVMSAMKRDQSIIFTAVPEEDCEQQVEKRIPSQNRPKFLNLKHKTTDEKKPVVNTPFHGQTSVCSTPMTDLSKVLHSKPLSICINETKLEKSPEKNSVLVKNDSSLNNIVSRVPYLTVTSNLYDCKKFSSVFDVREKGKNLDKSITMKYYNSEFREKYKISNDVTTPDKGRVFKTITDPNYPIFRSDGTLVSHPFYQDYLTNQMELITSEIKEEKPALNHSFDDFDSNLGEFVKSVKKIPDKVVETIEFSALPRPSKEHRKSLTLPLKSLSLDGGGEEPSPVRRHSSSVLLTPLMSKLSSFESSGFCSRDTTPIFTPTQPNFPFAFKRPKKLIPETDSLRKCVLFVCGQQDMVVTLLLQDEACASLELLTKLWEICTENLGKLEKQLHHCLETYPGGGAQGDSEPYSYLYLDSDWDTIHRGGPWGTAELGALTYFHRDFQESSSLIEILMRCCDGVIYGYQCGKSEVFYHQAANPNAGLPTPADPMSNVPLKARRRLERDHSIILL
ncbi:uncharacterized protein LOC123014426 isoform X2 [Tribolium madens]|uniref:uncharacterized protein LOC123014426 isoform X2 n=1 Tax=Tribolium madens TaxID=41895 RepID=UPI001CF7485B|nr:uncharacterized protein LOC123014426 isoform X2 [Tribolium madens]XP_044269483.1 uncharacterized protein LOC123014426 isoform X2 [Tribolium madens]XP_044269484.1 uncharacterized protein LOC123014426 isoform X2 [Tribolium madens]